MKVIPAMDLLGGRVGGRLCPRSALAWITTVAVASWT